MTVDGTQPSEACRIDEEKVLQHDPQRARGAFGGRVCVRPQLWLRNTGSDDGVSIEVKSGRHGRRRYHRQSAEWRI